MNERACICSGYKPFFTLAQISTKYFGVQSYRIGIGEPVIQEKADFGKDFHPVRGTLQA